ncbi:cytochrome c oxidase subunit 3 [Roseovarius sp. SCSIO 43702]|uniref:cytochrome c oxidase subunit 3 n=1 Tax=Roseovarius sp. SCSIO 43702 TaxID=2823043 RepID=UPI001C73D614|nr:cytochrome c oxidase subunit 3 [Roseovarius sp. SCSIO 43702]QYX56003.1 cytochrome c oxidase subunit 3 [Roseovarius sp. SCSIO 43702]
MSENVHPGINLGASHGEAHHGSERTAFGFWIFLMSDLVIFGILFATYVVMRPNLAGGPGPSELYDLKSIAKQTGLLLASSFTFGLVSLSMKYGSRTGAVAFWLVITAALGTGFLYLEIKDFARMAGDGGIPQRSGFLSSLWALVGLHGLHLVAGLAWIGVMLALITARGLSDAVKSRLLLLGLYWHFLDLIWIGIFSVVFLGGMA